MVIPPFGMLLRGISGTVLLAVLTVWGVRSWRGPATSVGDPARLPERLPSRGIAELKAACGRTASWVVQQLGPNAHAIVRPPFVVAGERAEAELDRLFCRSIAPAARAMTAQYFRHVSPDEPITVLVFGDEPSYRECARRLWGEENVSAYGYYRPHLRTLMVNLGRGESGLLHELTHALMAFDFPEAPQWLSEGLAALHEDGCLRSDGSGIDGLVNWRLPLLQEAIRRQRLPPLKTFLEDGAFSRVERGLAYAYARYLCMYLQGRGLLGECYRHSRARARADPSSAETLRRLLACRSWSDLDRDFRAWAVQLRFLQVVIDRGHFRGLECPRGDLHRGQLFDFGLPG